MHCKTTVQVVEGVEDPKLTLNSKQTSQFKKHICGEGHWNPFLSETSDCMEKSFRVKGYKRRMWGELPVEGLEREREKKSLICAIVFL